MSRSQDRELGMYRSITRRDFVNGVGVAVTGSLVTPGWISALNGQLLSPQVQEYYPPARNRHAGESPRLLRGRPRAP